LPNNYHYADTVAPLKPKTMLCVYACHIECFEIEMQVSKRRLRTQNVAGCTEVNLQCILNMQNKYRNFLIFIYIKHKTIIYMQALALVVYTWAENVAIYLFDNRT